MEIENLFDEWSTAYRAKGGKITVAKRALDGATGWRKMDDGSMGGFDWSNITEELPRK